MSDNGLPTEPVTTSGTKDSRRNRGARIRVEGAARRLHAERRAFLRAV